MKTLGVVFLVLISLSVCGHAAGQTPEELAARVQERYRDVKALEADYERFSKYVAAGSIARSRVKAFGRIVWLKPLKIRLDQNTPRKELFVANKREAWWVIPSRKRADHYPVSRFSKRLNPILIILNDMSELTKTFNLEPIAKDELPKGAKGQALALSPKMRKTDIKRIIIWFEPDKLLLGGFRYTNKIGDINEFILTNVQLNTKLESNLFSYEPPKGFRVYTRRINLDH